MVVYRPTKPGPAGKRVFTTRYYQFDGTLKGPDGRGHRVRRSTGQTTKKDAERIVAHWRKEAPIGGLSWLIPDDVSDMTMGEACTRLWQEVGQHQRSAKDLITNLSHCQRLLGAETRFVDIDASMIADAARRRAGEPRDPRKPEGQRVSLTTVNRQIVETMSRLHTRARKVWKPKGLILDIDWKSLKYEEGEARDRTLTERERAILWDAIRPDYLPVLWFNFNRGRRLAEMNPLRDDVDLDRGLVTVLIAKRNGKFRRETMELLPDEVELLRAEWKRAPGRRLFHYKVQHGPEKGLWKPHTYEGMKSYLHRLLNRLRREHPGLFEDLRVHDMRHDFATQLLRDSGNLEFVRIALMHRDIGSTMRYVHMVGHRAVTDAIGRAKGGYVPEGLRKKEVR